MPFVKVLRGGQITMPKECRQALEIKEGDILEVAIKENKVVLSPQVLIDKAPVVDLSERGEKMLNQGLKEAKEGKTKEFNNIEDLINDLHK